MELKRTRLVDRLLLDRTPLHARKGGLLGGLILNIVRVMNGFPVVMEGPAVRNSLL